MELVIVGLHKVGMKRKKKETAEFWDGARLPLLCSLSVVKSHEMGSWDKNSTCAPSVNLYPALSNKRGEY